MTSLPILRSLLFVPGSRVELLPKAEAARSDAIVLDLEDSVAADAKQRARAAVAAALGGRADRLTFIRFNHPELGMLEEDTAVLAAHDAQVVLIPKVDRVEDVRAVDERLARVEANHAMAPNSIGIVVGTETALGLRVLYDALRCTQRARGAVLASAEEGDLIVDLGGRWTPAGHALAYSRGKFVCDARAAGATWLLDGAFMNLESADLLRGESTLARDYGFNGKVAIHPRQVSVINEVFSPSAAEVDRAKRLVDAFNAALSQGQGAVKFEGMMVDYANVKRAERILIMLQRDK